MSEQLTPGYGGERYDCDELLEMGRKAAQVLGKFYLGEQESENLQEVLKPELYEGEPRGNIVPTLFYNSKDKKLHFRVEIDSILDFADQTAEELDDGIVSADIVRLLIGAGVARSILGWKTLPLRFLEDSPQRRAFQEQLCQKEPLWTATSAYDEEHGTNLRMTVERLGDEQITRINILRFAFGASLNHLWDAVDWQISVPNHMRKALAEREEERDIDLRTALGILEPESAFALYDDSTPELLLAFSFPMTPGEELANFAVETF